MPTKQLSRDTLYISVPTTSNTRHHFTKTTRNKENYLFSRTDLIDKHPPPPFKADNIFHLMLCIYVYMHIYNLVVCMCIYCGYKKFTDMHCVTPKTEVAIKSPITDIGIVILVFMYFNVLRMTT
jgi:hypothetical protein